MLDFLHRDEREYRVADFTRLVESKLHLQFAVRQAQNMVGLLALSRRIGAPLDHIDIVLTYRDLNHTWWPWHGLPMQARRHFVHMGELPE